MADYTDLYGDVAYPDPGQVDATLLDPRTAALRRRAKTLRQPQRAQVPLEAAPTEVPGEDMAQADEAAAPEYDAQAPGSEQDASQVLGAGAPNPELDLKSARAKALLGTEIPQGRMVGKVYVAASPFEMATAAGGRMLGAKLQKDAMKGRDPAARRKAAEAALRLPPDQQSPTLLLSQDPGFQRAGATLLSNQNKQQDRDLRELLFERRWANMTEADKARFERALQRDREQQAALDKRAAAGREAAQRRANTMAAAMKPMTGPQATAANRVAQGRNAFLDVLDYAFPSTDPVKGTLENVGEKVAQFGAPGLVSEDVAGRAAVWTDAIDPIVRIRTGAAMPNDEWLRTEYALRPKGGKSADAQISDVNRYLRHLRSGLIGVPDSPEVEAIKRDLDTMEARIPQNINEYNIFQQGVAERRAARRNLPARPGYTGAPVGAAGSAPAPAPTGAVMRGTSKSGRPIISNDGGKTWVYAE